MQHKQSRSILPVRRSSGGGADALANRGAAGSGSQPGIALFRKTVHHQDRNNGANMAGLQAMRQLSNEADASSSAARPQTTGSVHQSVAATRRQSMGSIHTTQHSSGPRLPTSPDTPSSSRNQQQPRLTRNLTLSDFRSTAAAAAAVAAGGSHYWSGARIGEGGARGAVVPRHGWQAEGSRGGQGGGTVRGIGDSGGRPSVPDRPLRRTLSRLPLLESAGGPGHTQQQQQQQRLLANSVENGELAEHGLSFGVSALKGRRPYMEDEYKVDTRDVIDVRW